MLERTGTTKGVACLFLLLLSPLGASAKQPIYQHGRLTAVSPKYIDSPALPSGYLFSPQILIGYTIQFQVEGVTYFADVASCCQQKGNLEWKANDPIEFRFDNSRLFVKRAPAKELQAKLLNAVPTIPNASPSPAAIFVPQFSPLVHSFRGPSMSRPCRWG
jgi:hypothetical protein